MNKNKKEGPVLTNISRFKNNLKLILSNFSSYKFWKFMKGKKRREIFLTKR